MTLPAGLGPFVEKLTALGGILDAARIRYGAGFELAEAIDALIGANYCRAEVWAMTPLAAALYFAERRRRREAAERLALDALAARGEPRELKKQIEDLRRD